MRRFSILSFLLVILAVQVLMVGCKSDDVVSSTYKTLAVAGVTYDATMKAAADAHQSGHILRQPLPVLMEMDVDELSMWHRAAKEIDG